MDFMNISLGAQWAFIIKAYHSTHRPPSVAFATQPGANLRRPEIPWLGARFFL
jgi:hypothetical protein